MDTGKLFIGAIILLVAIYLFVAQTDFTSRFLGGGIVAVVAIFLFIIPGFQKEKKVKRQDD